MPEAAPPGRARLDGMLAAARRPATAVVVGGALALPLLVGSNNYLMLVAALVGLYVIAVTGLDILYGYSGQASLGHAAFFAVGAYTTAILSTRWGAPFVVTLPAGCLLAAGLAIVIAVPGVRLVHHFLALLTVGLGEIVRLTLLNASDLTSGFAGIGNIPPPAVGGLRLDSYPRLYYLIVALALGGLWLKSNLAASRWGRILFAVRDNPRAAEAFGAHLVWVRTAAFAISAVYGAVGGALYAHLVTYISPDSFDLRQSTLFLTMVLIGGAGTLWGPVVGAVLLTLLTQFGQQYQAYQGAFYGLAIIAVVTLLPRGVVGSVDDLYRAHVRPVARRGGRGAVVVPARPDAPRETPDA